MGQLACGPEDHETKCTDCETNPNGGPISRNPDVWFLFIFHMSPSECDTRIDNLNALAMPQSHDSSMNS
jgi:hypothetical protein